MFKKSLYCNRQAGVGQFLAPLLENRHWCVLLVPILGHTLPVETLVLDQCWTNVSKSTMTYCQQLQPFPNVDSTIGSYLGRAIAFKEKITKCWMLWLRTSSYLSPPRTKFRGGGRAYIGITLSVRKRVAYINVSDTTLTFDLKVKFIWILAWLRVRVTANLFFVIAKQHLNLECITIGQCVTYIHGLCMTLTFGFKIKVLFLPWTCFCAIIFVFKK